MLAAPPVVIRENAGGGALVDSIQRPFDGDGGFIGGAASAAVHDVTNTPDDALFATHRSGPAFTYSRAVANGRYALWLDFADPTSAAAGERAFDVSVEGERRLSKLDVFAEAGGARAALSKSLDVTVADGRLDLSFVGVKGDAIVSAIVLLPVEAPEAVRPYVPDSGRYEGGTPMGDARNHALHTLSQSNLREIGLHLLVYANENRGALPPALAALTRYGDRMPAALVGPRTTTLSPRGERTAVEHAAWAARLADYLYLGAGKRSRDFGAGAPLAYENPDRVDGDINVLMGDGSVRRRTRAEAAALIGFRDAPPVDAPPARDPFAPRGAVDPRVYDSAANLREIARAMQFYANENRGRYPATAGLLVRTQDVEAARFVNPRSSTVPPPTGQTSEEAGAWVDAHSDYVYLGAGRSLAAPDDDVLFFENPREMTGGVNVLFADGRVEFREMRWALEVVARVGATGRLPRPGDATGDGAVNFADLVALAQNYDAAGGVSFARGDFNYDDRVDFDDLVVLGQRYEATVAASVALAGAEASGAAVTPNAKAAGVKAKPVFAASPIAKVRPVKLAVRAPRR
jgi:prepilin-type processing-associated H-X9-DG protein